MLLQDPNLKIWLYTEPTDMRKQFDGLAAIAKNKLAGELNGQHLFVFINRKRTQIKILYYATGGLCLWAKRLEKGQFQSIVSSETGEAKYPLSWSSLHCLIDGINWLKAPQIKRFKGVV